VIFENDLGFEVFETSGSGEKATDDKMLKTKIEMQDIRGSDLRLEHALNTFTSL
jgi:hypothetical protein